jgi:hypothetical protein
MNKNYLNKKRIRVNEEISTMVEASSEINVEDVLSRYYNYINY